MLIPTPLVLLVDVRVTDGDDMLTNWEYVDIQGSYRRIGKFTAPIRKHNIPTGVVV